jgi:hypothetical protein
MNDRHAAPRAVGDAHRGAAAGNPPHPLRRPTNPISLLMLAACVATLTISGTSAAPAKQQCRVTSLSGRGYWSWRLIDGRKCWYEGKPMLSKSLLEWPARAAAPPDSGRELARVPEKKASDPLDAEAYVPNESTTFEGLWRDRIEKH